MAPEAFSKCLDMGMMYTLHDLHVSPPTAFDFSWKDSRVAKYLEGATHILQEEQVMPVEGLSTASIWSRGLEMEFN